MAAGIRAQALAPDTQALVYMRVAVRILVFAVVSSNPAAQYF